MYKTILFTNLVLCSKTNIEDEQPELFNDPETPLLEVFENNPTEILETLTYDDFKTI